MPGQRRTAGPRARGSRLPRRVGLGAVVLVTGAAVTGYLIAFHPAVGHHAPPLPTRVVSYQTVGLVVAETEPGSSTDQLLQLVGAHSTPTFSALGQTQAAEGSPQWTADLMAGGDYVFIYLPTGQCLGAAGTASQPKLELRRCDLDADQRWQRTQRSVSIQAHDFYQYTNLADRSCLTQTGVLPGQIFGASLAACAPSERADQLIAFWWSAS
jgi:nitric oxide reductase large subunit